MVPTGRARPLSEVPLWRGKDFFEVQIFVDYGIEHLVDFIERNPWLPDQSIFQVRGWNEVIYRFTRRRLFIYEKILKQNVETSCCDVLWNWMDTPGNQALAKLELIEFISKTSKLRFTLCLRSVESQHLGELMCKENDAHLLPRQEWLYEASVHRPSNHPNPSLWCCSRWPSMEGIFYSCGRASFRSCCNKKIIEVNSFNFQIK